jgi:hypothetical protein
MRYEQIPNKYTVNLPADITKILDLLKFASQWMFGLFLTGTVLEFIMIFLAPLPIYSRLISIIVGLLTLVAAICTTVATVIATALFIIFRNAIGSFPDLNIGATIGIKIFVFMWIATAFAIFAAFIQLGLCCCCASRRDVKRGKKRGTQRAYTNEANSAEKPERRGIFGRRKA